MQRAGIAGRPGNNGAAARKWDNAGMTSPRTGTRSALQTFFETERPEGVVSAYLFGSFAEGREHRESDVDLAVFLDRRILTSRRDRFEKRVELGSCLIHALGRNEIDILVLNEAPPLLARRVLREGIRVYCDDLDQDRDFSRDVQLRAADLEPFLDRYRATKLAALAQ